MPLPGKSAIRPARIDGGLTTTLPLKLCTVSLKQPRNHMCKISWKCSVHPTELRHRNFYWACVGRADAINRGQHFLGGHVDCVSALAIRNDFVGKDALKLELLPEVDFDCLHDGTRALGR